jgi:hypothetical protein
MDERYEDRPKRFVIEMPNGKLIELDEGTTAELYAQADRDGVRPEECLSTLIHTAFLLMEAELSVPRKP